MTTFSALALLVAAGSSVAADSQSQSYLLTTHARSLGMRAIKKARSKVLAGRRMKETGDDTDMSDLGMGGFDMGGFDLGGSDMSDVTGEQLNQMVPLMCMLFESGMIQDELEDNLDTDMETVGVVCSDFGCDDAATPNLVMNCTMDREYCDGEGDEEFCVMDSTIYSSMGLDFVDTSQLTTTQCSTYTKPAYMKALGHGCWTVDASINFGTMMEAVMEADPVEMGTMTEEEAVKMSTEYIKITDCSADFGDGTKCECGTCNDGMGFELTCDNNGNNLVSEECTDFDTSVADIGAISGGNTTSPEISVMKLSATPDAGNVVKETDADSGAAMKTDDTSPAASRAQAMVAGLVLAFASFLALM